MRASLMFPSKYLRAADFEAPALLTMKKIEIEDVADGEPKPVLYFEEKEKGVVLNKTNANTIAETYGDDTTEWFGNKIVLYEAETSFQGKTMPCIRMRKPKMTKQQSEQEMGDKIPF